MINPRNVGIFAKHSATVANRGCLFAETELNTTPEEVDPRSLPSVTSSPQAGLQSDKTAESQLAETHTAITIYLREIGRIPLLTPQHEIELAARIKDGDHQARSLMINSNLRLVVTIAQHYANLGVPLLDLISEGNIGLIMAVDRFDPSKGAKFSTYAAWWIKQSLRRALSNQSKTIRLPVHHFDKISKMRRVTLQLSEELGREPTDEELSEEIGIARVTISQLRTTSNCPASLDASIGNDDLTELGEIIADEGARSPFELLRDKDLQSEIGGLLKGLADREKKIISQRFGFDGEEQKTLQEVANDLGSSRERIRQLENMALSKLRRALNLERDAIGMPVPI
jgi:RNA polymerase primary sigma factor